jgi:fumarylpyruvate hydrolase
MVDNTRREFIATSLIATAGIAVATVSTTSAAQTNAGDTTVVPMPPPVLLNVVGSDAKFPVRRIYCVGRNYLAHVRELNNKEAEPPFFFQKQRDMVVHNGGKVRYPALTKDFQFETELVVALKTGGSNVSKENANSLIYGYAVGFDMTRRDRQSDMKKMEKPWEVGKSFEDSAPCGDITPAEKTGFLTKGRIKLEVEGKTRQDSNLDHMIWDVVSIIAELSKQVDLAPGDLIYTGTPEGVGPVQKGERMVAMIDGLQTLTVDVV